MIQGITPEDFLKLGNPATCKQYIFTMANAIYRLFEELQIRPTKDRSGTIVFQKLETLKSGGDSKAVQQDTRQYCLIVAYTYIRIFQIFGALALTIVDDETAGQVLGVLQAGLAQPPPAMARGPRGVFLGGSDATQRGGSDATQRGGSQTGGAPLSDDTLRQKYRDYYNMLTYQADNEQGNPTYFFDDNTDIVFTHPRGGGSPTLRLQKANGFTVKATLNIVADTKGTLSLKLTSISLEKVAADHQAQSEKLKTAFRNMYKAGLLLPIQRGTDDTRGRIFYKDGETSVGTVLIEKLWEKYRAIVKGKMDGHVIPGSREAAEQFAEKTARDSDIGILKQLQTGFMLAAMKKLSGYKTTPFCVARGLQLLDANTQFAMGRVPVAQSSVCQTKLSGVPHSVPVQGEPLDRTPGIKAIEQLWYTQPVLKTDVSEGHDVKLSPQDTAGYAAFIQEFAKLFGKATTTAPTTLGSVVAAGPQTCSAAANKYLQISNPAEIQKILGHISKLYAIQLTHTRNVIRFLRNRLFLIQKRPDPARGGALGDLVMIHPKILQGGIKELATVSAEARELLVKYYSACEGTYQEGVRLVMAAKTTAV